MATGPHIDILARLFQAREQAEELAEAQTATLAQQLSAMLAFAPVTIAVIARDARILQVTATADRGDLIGRSLFDQLHPSSHGAFRHRLDQTLTLGEPVEIEVRACDDDTQARWYRLRLEPLRGEAAPDGAWVTGAIALLAPMDQERQARIESKRFRAILDQADEAIFVVDPRSTRFVDVNDTACQMLRYTRAELLERGPRDIEIDFPLHTREQWADYIIEIMAVGTLPYEGVHRRKDGTTYPVEATWSIKPFEGDEYLLGVCRDITEGRRIQEELRHAEETLRVNDRLTAVGTMAAGIAHEINNPLAYVMGNIEFSSDVLQELSPSLPEKLSVEILDALREARHGAALMSRIVRDLRTFSRRDDDSMGAVEVNEVIESSINIAMNEIRLRAQIVREYTDDLLVMANEPRLGQVLLNLLINAAQAIEPGDSRNQRITVRTARGGSAGVVVEISDTGSGMREEVRARIFEPFFTTKPIGVGTGLGLAICRSIIEALGGTIEVESALGQGTTFRLHLPAALEDREAEAAPAVAEHDGKLGRILIIDDDEHSAKALRRCLSQHEGAIASNGHDGLERLLSDQFDLVFCEMVMPDFGGIALYEAVQQRSPALAPRIIMVLSGPLDQKAEDFLHSHDIMHIAKPYDAAQVRRLVAKRL